MREGRSWKWQADYYGLAGVIHCMLHNKYLQVIQTHISDDDGGYNGYNNSNNNMSSLSSSSSSSSSSLLSKKMRYRPMLSFKRYWQVSLWKRLFDILLNSSLLVKSIDNENDDDEDDDVNDLLPIDEELKEIRREFENYLVENCEKSGKSLKSLLKKLEMKMFM